MRGSFGNRASLIDGSQSHHPKSQLPLCLDLVTLEAAWKLGVTDRSLGFIAAHPGRITGSLVTRTLLRNSARPLTKLKLKLIV